MVLSKSQVMEQVKKIIGENTDDDTLKFIEDISDTLDDFETKVNGDGEDWKQKYNDLDKEWRNKYRERFFSGTDDKKEEPKNDLLEPSGTEDDEGENDAPETFEDLFTEG